MFRCRQPLLACFVFFLFISCKNGNNTGENDLSPGAIYFDYRVWGDEEGGNAIVKLQYRQGGKMGSSVSLKEPAGVRFDGEILTPDSTRYNGVYYEVLQPAAAFAGEHVISVTTPDKTEYETRFNFPLVYFKTEMPEIVHRGNLEIELEGLQPRDRVRISLIDTSFLGKGVERLDEVRNGRILITERDMENLGNGPISMVLTREEEIDLKHKTRAGGKFLLTYSLRRDFLLED